MDDDLIVINDGEVDVVEIMKTIRERIQRKRELGIYTDEEVEEIATLRLQGYADEAEIDSELLGKLLQPNHNWNIRVDYRIKSHRGGLKAGLIVLAKKLVRPFVRLYTDHVLNRQAQLNLYFTHLLHNLVRETTRLQLQVNALKNRCDLLEREKDFLEKRGKTLEKMVDLRDPPGDE
ncbi:hypothetical protein JW905_15675 [bacterium]|nr:hypothetical protein [candidate division CSSED10-310 bacterium]